VFVTFRNTPLVAGVGEKALSMAGRAFVDADGETTFGGWPRGMPDATRRSYPGRARRGNPLLERRCPGDIGAPASRRLVLAGWKPAPREAGAPG
jgi:hypothetical protein